MRPPEEDDMDTGTTRTRDEEKEKLEAAALVAIIKTLADIDPGGFRRFAVWAAAGKFFGYSGALRGFLSASCPRCR
jgi:hypothetical protein